MRLHAFTRLRPKHVFALVIMRLRESGARCAWHRFPPRASRVFSNRRKQKKDTYAEDSFCFSQSALSFMHYVQRKRKSEKRRFMQFLSGNWLGLERLYVLLILRTKGKSNEQKGMGWFHQYGISILD